jgi:hypothetical protein
MAKEVIIEGSAVPLTGWDFIFIAVFSLLVATLIKKVRGRRLCMFVQFVKMQCAVFV